MCDFSSNSQFLFADAATFVSYCDSLLLTSATEILDVKPFVSVTLALNVISYFAVCKSLLGMVTCYWSIINHRWEERSTGPNCVHITLLAKKIMTIALLRLRCKSTKQDCA